MTSVWPKFRIFAVKDGISSGLLIERQMTHDAPTEKIYCWLTVAEGLAPTEEIMKACGNIHELISGECNRSFMNLLIGFTTFAHHTGKLKVPTETLNKYLTGKQCQRIIDHFCERGDVILRDFFINPETFKDTVLRKEDNKENLIGSALEFRVISPHDIINIGDGYLKQIDHVLKVGYGDPEWFRREGPIAVDFARMVYPRQMLLEELKKMVLNNSFSLLEGQPATGKTVLVRQLGYELWQREKLSVYWFDGAVRRDFNVDHLIKEINSILGICIIENIHINTPQYQAIYYSVVKDQNRHVLFTARTSFKHSEIEKQWKISDLKHMTLNPFDQVDEIITHFGRSITSIGLKLGLAIENYYSIKGVSEKSFWILGYALKGYVEANGEGEPKNWIRDGVDKDLKELERRNTCFPEIMVSLSPLYQNEVRTEEQFLIKILGFDLAILKQLVCAGEITSQETEEGYVFYGLPHSALAKLYWEYGRVYRRRKDLPEYEEFLYSYVTSDVPNALEAAVKGHMPINRALPYRLENEGQLVIIHPKNWAHS